MKFGLWDLCTADVLTFCVTKFYQNIVTTLLVKTHSPNQIVSDVNSKAWPASKLLKHTKSISVISLFQMHSVWWANCWKMSLTLLYNDSDQIKQILVLMLDMIICCICYDSLFDLKWEVLILIIWIGVEHTTRWCLLSSHFGGLIGNLTWKYFKILNMRSLIVLFFDLYMTMSPMAKLFSFFCTTYLLD